MYSNKSTKWYVVRFRLFLVVFSDAHVGGKYWAVSLRSWSYEQLSAIDDVTLPKTVVSSVLSKKKSVLDYDNPDIETATAGHCIGTR